VVIVMAAWMLDPAACAGMTFGTPRVSISALAELLPMVVAKEGTGLAKGNPEPQACQ
jgi:hypothetical protein